MHSNFSIYTHFKFFQILINFRLFQILINLIFSVNYISRFNRLKPHVVLDRLVFRKHYGLAIQIAKHLKLPESRILEHWAFHKVTYDKSNNILINIEIFFHGTTN